MADDPCSAVKANTSGEILTLPNCDKEASGQLTVNLTLQSVPENNGNTTGALQLRNAVPSPLERIVWALEQRLIPADRIIYEFYYEDVDPTRLKERNDFLFQLLSDDIQALSAEERWKKYLGGDDIFSAILGMVEIQHPIDPERRMGKECATVNKADYEVRKTEARKRYLSVASNKHDRNDQTILSFDIDPINLARIGNCAFEMANPWSLILKLPEPQREWQVVVPLADKALIFWPEENWPDNEGRQTEEIRRKRHLEWAVHQQWVCITELEKYPGYPILPQLTIAGKRILNEPKTSIDRSNLKSLISDKSPADDPNITKKTHRKGAHPKDWISSKQLDLFVYLLKHDSQPFTDRQIAEAVEAYPSKPALRTTQDNLVTIRKVKWAKADGKNGTTLTELGRREIEKILRKSKKI